MFFHSSLHSTTCVSHFHASDILLTSSNDQSEELNLSAHSACTEFLLRQHGGGSLLSVCTPLVIHCLSKHQLCFSASSLEGERRIHSATRPPSMPFSLTGSTIVYGEDPPIMGKIMELAGKGLKNSKDLNKYAALLSGGVLYLVPEREN